MHPSPFLFCDLCIWRKYLQRRLRNMTRAWTHLVSFLINWCLVNEMAFSLTNLMKKKFIKLNNLWSKSRKKYLLNPRTRTENEVDILVLVPMSLTQLKCYMNLLSYSKVVQGALMWGLLHAHWSAQQVSVCPGSITLTGKLDWGDCLVFLIFETFGMIISSEALLANALISWDYLWQLQVALGKSA